MKRHKIPSERASRAAVAISLLLLGAILSAGVWLSIAYGIDFTDMGFIEGSAYRVFLGQHLYRDFDYIRPPLTPWLWHFPFYLASDGLEILLRSLVVLQKAAIGWLLAGALARLDVEPTTSRITGVVAFTFLLFWLPAMPWHTVDGLFFIALSVRFFAQRWFSAALCASIAAALCKQSFYPAPLLMFVMIIVEDRWRAALSAIAGAFLLLLVAYRFDMADFFRLSSDAGSAKDILVYGILPHFEPTKGLVLGFGFPLVVGLVCWLRGRPVLQPMLLAILFVPAIPVARSIAIRIVSGRDIGMPAWEGLSHAAAVLVFVAIAAALIRQRRNPFVERRLLAAGFLAAGAWMSTLSWGNPHYLAAYGLLVASAMLVLEGEISLRGPGAIAIVGIAALTFGAGRLLNPFLKMESPLLVAHEMVPSGHYKYIRVSPREGEMLRSIQRIAGVEGCKDTYPSVPQAALVGRYVPALRADWKMDVEYPSHGTDGEKAKIRQCRFFIERDADIPTGGIYKSTLLPQALLKSCGKDFDDNFRVLDAATCDPSRAR